MTEQKPQSFHRSLGNAGTAANSKIAAASWLLAIFVVVILAASLSAASFADGVKPLKAPATPAQIAYQAGLDALTAKKYTQAEANFQQSLRLDPKFFQAYLGLADLRLEKGDTAGAGVYLQKARAAAPDDVTTQTDWGHFLFFRKRYDEAEEVLKKAVSLDPKAPRARVELGDLYLLGLKKPQDAANSYSAALAIDPKNARVHYTLANAYAELGKPDDAAEQLTQAIALDAKNPLFRMTLGELQLRRGQVDAAESNYKKVLETLPSYAPAQAGLGDVWVARRNYPEAESAFQKSVKLAPRSTGTIIKLAVVQEVRGETAGAEQSYRKALAVEPQNGLAANNLAWLLAEKHKQYSEALVLAKKAVASDPKNGAFLDTLGWVMRGKGDKAGALETLKKAVALAPKNPENEYHLGVAYQETGDTASAVRSYEHALSLGQNFDGADDAKTRLAALKHS